MSDKGHVGWSPDYQSPKPGVSTAHLSVPAAQGIKSPKDKEVISERARKSLERVQGGGQVSSPLDRRVSGLRNLRGGDGRDGMTLTETIERWLEENGYERLESELGMTLWTRPEWANWWKDPKTKEPSDYPRRQHPVDVLVPIILSSEKHGHEV